jgi:MFS family permease
MANFPLIFGLSLVLNVAVTFRSSDHYKKLVTGRNPESAVADLSEKELAQKKQWEIILRKYLAVYLLATLSDWLQGPYVYALYADYGFSQHEIAILFVAGFGSSMVFGSFIGGMADWGGRRNFVVLFAIIYAASCVTKRTLCYVMLCYIVLCCHEDTNAVRLCLVLSCLLTLLNHLLYLLPTTTTNSFYRFQELLRAHAGSIAGRRGHLAALFRL